MDEKLRRRRVQNPEDLDIPKSKLQMIIDLIRLYIDEVKPKEEPLYTRGLIDFLKGVLESDQPRKGRMTRREYFILLKAVMPLHFGYMGDPLEKDGKKYYAQPATWREQ